MKTCRDCEFYRHPAIYSLCLTYESNMLLSNKPKKGDEQANLQCPQMQLVEKLRKELLDRAKTLDLALLYLTHIHQTAFLACAEADIPRESLEHTNKAFFNVFRKEN